MHQRAESMPAFAAVLRLAMVIQHGDTESPLSFTETFRMISLSLSLYLSISIYIYIYIMYHYIMVCVHF